MVSPAQALRRYQAKRDFNKTAEPASDDPLPKDLPKKPSTGARFVIQKHAASRLHYDFRLEIDGVLKSWAVPKGPSLDTKDRRLAVEVEDHPLGYGAFEGTIPHGEYGGGTVLLWDQGTFTLVDEGSDALAQWRAGKLSFVLHGDRLQGRFHLVRVPKRGTEKQTSWMLMKGNDAHVVVGGDVDHLSDISVKTGRSLDEIAASSNRTPRARGATKKKKTTTKTKKKATTSRTEAAVSAVQISNGDRLVFGDDSAVTKALLARYMEVMAPLILPYVRQRPLSVVRCPQGIGAACFFQKHVAKGMPDGIGTIEVDGEQWLMVDDASGLVGLVQMGGIELHPWGALPGAPEQPDRITMDVDPGDDVPWPRVVEAAVQLRERLAAYGLESFVKSTGGKGLHVCAPLDGRASWDAVKRFCRSIADDMERDAPALYTANMRKHRRVGRIFIDFLRNGRGATAIAPYSPRARPDAPVSVPLRWDEIATPPTWTVLTVHERVRAADPWAQWFDVEQGLGARRGRALRVKRDASLLSSVASVKGVVGAGGRRGAGHRSASRVQSEVQANEPGASMNIYDVLISDHREVVGLLKKAEKAEGEARQALLTTIIDALSAHAIAEGEVLYDNIENTGDDVHDLVMEAHEEHLSAARLMKELLDPSVNDDRRAAKTTLLREQIEHHVEEEEGDMFTKSRRLINEQAAEALAGEFLARKEQLMARPVAERVDEAIATEEKLARTGSPPKRAKPVDGEARQPSSMSAR